MAASNVAAFYAGRSVFVTGATGLIGKVLLEKLLRSCRGVDKIYLLIRIKKQVDAEKRLCQLLECPVFQQFREHEPSALDKLVLVAGDVSQPRLGMSERDLDTLRARVSVVFHCAARVNFDSDLAAAVNMNVKGTRELVDLCHRLPHLQVLVHVSTCFLHPNHVILEERVSAPPISAEELIECVDSGDERRIQQMTQRVLDYTGCPIVYGFTKAASEQLLTERGAGLPLVVVRPAIVTAAQGEPLAGWVDNLNGPTGFIAGASKGFLRTLHFERDAVSQLIPVDCVVNMMVAAAWRRATHKTSGATVYNCSTGQLNPMTHDEFREKALAIGIDYPVQGAIWYPVIAATSVKWVNQVNIALFHYLPAVLLDAVALLIGRRPKLVKMYNKMHRLLPLVDFYNTRPWEFKTAGLVELQSALSEEDARTFNFDVRLIDWVEYLRTYVLGVRQFIHKEDLTTLPAARRSLQMFYWLRILIRVLLLASLLWIVLCLPVW